MFVTPNVPVTSFKRKFAINCPSGASVYLNPCFVTLTLSTAPISFVSARRTAPVPAAEVTEIEGSRGFAGSTERGHGRRKKAADKS